MECTYHGYEGEDPCDACHLGCGGDQNCHDNCDHDYCEGAPGCLDDCAGIDDIVGDDPMEVCPFLNSVWTESDSTSCAFDCQFTDQYDEINMMAYICEGCYDHTDPASTTCVDWFDIMDHDGDDECNNCHDDCYENNDTGECHDMCNYEYCGDDGGDDTCSDCYDDCYENNDTQECLDNCDNTVCDCGDDLCCQCHDGCGDDDADTTSAMNLGLESSEA